MAGKYQSVDDYIEGCSDAVVPLMKKLRAFIHEQLPNATEELQYGPVTLQCRSGFSFMRPELRRPRGFATLELNAVFADCRNR